jgi:hypothetical protein
VSLWASEGSLLASHRSELRQSFDAAARELAYWNERLKRIDPALQLVRASSNATMPGLRPGYYHVVRDNGASPPTIIVHEGEDGEWLEPNSFMLERLEKGDVWNTRAVRESEKITKAAAREAEAERVLEREDRKEELKSRIKHAVSPGTRFDKGIPS